MKSARITPDDRNLPVLFSGLDTHRHTPALYIMLTDTKVGEMECINKVLSVRRKETFHFIVSLFVSAFYKHLIFIRFLKTKQHGATTIQLTTNS